MPRRKQSRPARVPRMFRKTHVFKTNKNKRAYAPKKKRKFIRSSNPVAENKQVEGSQLSTTAGLNNANAPVLTNYNLPPVYPYGHASAGQPNGAGGYSMNTATWHFNPDSMLYQYHGFNDHEMVGRNVFQRLCAAKFLIKWPQSTMNTGIDKDPTSPSPLLANNIAGVIPSTPQNYTLYWGYVPRKLLYTDSTPIKAYQVGAYDIESEINQRVRDYFNERTDRTAFIPKTTATIKIIGKKRLFPPWSMTTGRAPTTYDQGYGENLEDGSIPDTLVKIKWDINRKIHFEPTNMFAARTLADGTRVNDTSGETAFYRNYDWLPFAVIVNYNHDKLPVDNPDATSHLDRYERTRRCPQVLVNDITYYRDS